MVIAAGRLKRAGIYAALILFVLPVDFTIDHIVVFVLIVDIVARPNAVVYYFGG